jgi:hypothetical protein
MRNFVLIVEKRTSMGGYYLAECSRLAVFRLGSVLCARKSALL